MRATVISPLNKRQFPSTRNVPLSNPHLPNDILEIVAEVEGEAPQNSSNTKWYKTNQGYYVWSGGVLKTENLHTLAYEADALDWWHHDFDIPELWSVLGMGKGAKITIIDSGIDSTHPYFNSQNITADSIIKTWGTVDNWKHGTQVSSMIIANGKKFIGIAPEVNLHMIKVFNRNNTTISDMIKALAMVPGNTDILCISRTFPQGIDTPKLEQELEQEIEKLNNPLVICAAGNSSDHTKYDENLPAILDCAISIGSCQQGGGISPNSSKSKKIKLVAPGHKVKCLFPKRVDYLGPAYGTSFSAPFVAGLAAIGIAYLRREKKEIDPVKIKQFLLDSSDPVAGGDPHLYGSGIINTSKFVTKILSI